MILYATFGDYLKQRVFSQTLMVVSAAGGFVAQCDAEDTLGEHGSLLMNGIEGITRVRDAAIYGINQANTTVKLSQKQ